MLGVMGLLAVLNRDYVKPYASLVGQLVLLVVVALLAAGLLWLRSLASARHDRTLPRARRRRRDGRPPPAGRRGGAVIAAALYGAVIGLGLFAADPRLAAAQTGHLDTRAPHRRRRKSMTTQTITELEAQRHGVLDRRCAASPTGSRCSPRSGGGGWGGVRRDLAIMNRTIGTHLAARR